MAKILIIGCGDVGTRLGENLADRGHVVTGLRRNPKTGHSKIRMLAGDIGDRSTLEGLAGDFNLLFFIVSADGRTEESYRIVYEAGLGHVLNRFKGLPMVFVSSTSVYGQCRGEWVDENSQANPENFNGRIIRQAEQLVLAAHTANTVVRFSGIYGPGREYLLQLAARAPEIQRIPPYYTNRIHVDDCVGVLSLLSTVHLAGTPLQPIYLASDDDPAPMFEVVCWMAERLQCPLPNVKTVAENASMNKRCKNELLKAAGYRFRYPSYRDGYGEMLNS